MGMEGECPNFVTPLARSILRQAQDERDGEDPHPGGERGKRGCRWGKEEGDGVKLRRTPTFE